MMKTDPKLYLALLITPLLTSCASMPALPVGQLCLFNSATFQSVCEPISPDKVKGSRYEVLSGMNANYVMAKDMDNWITLDGDSWEALQVYLNQLKALLQEQLSQ